MKKNILKEEFIEMKVNGCTLDEISRELKISKPTAVKWSKDFAEEIEIEKIDLYSKHLIGELTENEDMLYYHIENFRSASRTLKETPGLSRYTEKTFKRLSQLFKQRIHAATVLFDKKNKGIKSITFVFKKDTSLQITTNYRNYEAITYR